VAWDPRPDSDGDDPNVGSLRREVWIRTGRVVDAQRALSIGTSLVAGAAPGQHGREYVRQLVAGAALEQVAALFGVAPAVPERPVVAVPDPEADAAMAQLRGKRAARADRIAVWERCAGDAREQLEAR
jgi:hypothetical protein